MIRSHNLKKQHGFTIVELLIVIVVIGILAALVLNSFSGVQAKARDTERNTDTKAIATQLEAYYNNSGSGAGNGNGKYPGTADLVTGGDTWATANLKGIDLAALKAPGVAANSVIAATNAVATTAGVLPQPTKDQYVYQPLDAANALCTAAGGACTKFSIFYRTEVDNAVQVRASLNQ